MTRNAALLAAGAVTLSLAVHAAGFLAFDQADPPALAGGIQQVAMIGNSFADAAAGTVSEQTTPERTAPVPVAKAAPTPPLAAAQSATTPAATAPSSLDIVISSARIPSTATSPPTVAPRTNEPVVPTPIARITETSPAEARTVATTVQPEIREATADTPRPRERGERQEPTPERQVARTAPATQPAGNAEQTTRRGEATGQAQGNAARTTRGGEVDGAGDSRAAAAYPSLVNGQIARTRRESSNLTGTAVVSFTVSTSGTLAGLGIARSSGNSKLDRIALDHIRRAAPFPAPPAGAQRSFSVAIQGSR